MHFELDHFFILTKPGGTEADLLQSYGLREGEPNRHPGQGTANRRFFFANAMLELLWVCDEAEALNSPADHLRLVERSNWRENRASPFGICFRPVDTNPIETPFPGWTYRPSYLPALSDGFGRESAKSIRQALLSDNESQVCATGVSCALHWRLRLWTEPARRRSHSACPRAIGRRFGIG